jgi:hypothetical protein
VFYLLIQEDFPPTAIVVHGTGGFFCASPLIGFEVAILLSTAALTTRKLDESPFRFVKRFALPKPDCHQRDRRGRIAHVQDVKQACRLDGAGRRA